MSRGTASQGATGPAGPPGTGDVNGPATSTDSTLAQWDGTTGDLLKDGLATSEGGNGSSDAGKVAIFGIDGQLVGGSSAGTPAVSGSNLGAGDGVNGHSVSGIGVYGNSDTDVGVHGRTGGVGDIAHFENSSNTGMQVTNDGGLDWDSATGAQTTRTNALPTQGGNSGKFLKTNGTDVSWDTPSSGSGDVVGPASATDNAITRFDGTTGKLVQNSGATVDDSGNIAATNLSGTNTGDQTSVSGNAGTATALQTARNINGVSFNGTADITVPAAAGTLTGATLAAGVTASSLTSVGTLATLAVTAPISGSVTGNAGTSTALATGRTIAITGDLAYTSPSFDGTGNVTAAGTLATVNADVGTFGSATLAAVLTVNAKGLITAIADTTIRPPVGNLTGLGTGVATALAVNVGSAGAPVLFNGAGGTPSSMTATNLSGTAAALNIGGNAATVTTNANLTGPITSVGNATTIADAELAAIAGLTSAANKGIQFTGSGTAALIDSKNGVEAAYTGTITWTAGAAPSSTANLRQFFQWNGNVVVWTILLTYATTGTTVTNVSLTFPTEFPTPAMPTGFTGASVKIWPLSTVRLITTPTGTITVSNTFCISRNSGDTAFEISGAAFTSGSYRTFQFAGQYFTS